MKKFLILLLILAVIAGAALYLFRESVVQYSAETLLKKNLPDYVSIEDLEFRMDKGELIVNGFALRNPSGFNNRYLATVDSITCVYRLRGSNITEGIKVTGITASSPVINIERSNTGKLNLAEMGGVMDKGDGQAKESKASAGGAGTEDPSGGTGGKGRFKVSDFLELSDRINIRGGKVNVLDKYISRSPYAITFEDVDAFIDLPLSDDLSEVLSLTTEGKGLLNGKRGQMIDWRITMADPDAPSRNLGTRFNFRNIDITLFEPYYDRYSPIVIKKAEASGTIVFDLDNGNIGSQNEIVFRGLEFQQKQGGKWTNNWQVSVVPDIVQYLRSAPGEVAFDFKIKGSLDDPRFLPGPRVERAVQSMAVDTIADILAPKDEQSGESGGGQQGKSSGGAPKSDTEKVMDAIRGLLDR
ncbi:MAG: DUF748 domain-containing protein [Candidatus Omnitrophica bacterium]|nr:DUF748 domain-containing protein [Candidatus Omnitrophota bacterium]